MICLLPNCAYLSETSRMLAVYKALRARGAECCIATHGGTHESFLKQEGAPYDLLEPRMSAERCSRLVEASTTIRAGVRLHTADELRAEVQSQSRFFRDRGIRMAVTGFTLSALLSTRVARIPLATSHAGCFVPPVVERDICPASSRPGLLFRFLPPSAQRRLSNWLLPRIRFFCAEFNQVADELAVPRVPSFPALFLGDLTLVTEIPEVLGISREELESWKPARPEAYRPDCQLRYTGPVFARLQVPVPERVESFLRDERDRRPLVYVAMTSTPAPTVSRILEALRPLDVRILALSTVHDLPDPGRSGVIVEPFLPSDKIMPRVDVAVIAGGQGSVQCAMASGIPFVGVPLQGEQDLNVHLAQKLGVARLVPLGEADGPTMAAQVRALLDDRSAREAASRIRDRYAKIDGADETARVILEYLDERSPRRGRASDALS